MFIHFRIRICGNRSKSIATYLGECTLILYIPAMLGELQGPRLVTHIHLSSSKFQLWLQLSAHKYNIYIYTVCIYIYTVCIIFLLLILLLLLLLLLLYYIHMYIRKLTFIHFWYRSILDWLKYAKLLPLTAPHGRHWRRETMRMWMIHGESLVNDWYNVGPHSFVCWFMKTR